MALARKIGLHKLMERASDGVVQEVIQPPTSMPRARPRRMC